MNRSHAQILPLLIIVALLAFSVRLVDFTLGVSSLNRIAQAAPASSEEKEEKESTEKKTKKSTKKSSADNEIEWRDAKDEAIGDGRVREDVLKDIASRRKALDERERSLTSREALLRASQQQLEQKTKELQHLRTEIENLLGKQSEEEEKRIESLVKVYEGMKPKDAARIFDTLDLDVLVSVMSRMSERKMSPVLAAMNPERARTVTIMLAEEKQLPKL